MVDIAAADHRNVLATGRLAEAGSTFADWIDRSMDMVLDPRALLQIAWRRKWFFLIPASVVFTAAVAAIFVLPQLYRSQATLIIEQQDIPENFVPSIVTEQIDRRLDAITREVLATDNLVRIADGFNLYADERENMSTTAVAARMRERFDIETLITEFNDARSGRRRQATLGFQISFLDADPRKARQITNELISIYVSNNIEIRRDVAERTSTFLANERELLDRRINDIEDQITQFTTVNRELVPREAAFKRQILNNTEQRLRSLESDLRALRERGSYLTTQLALIDEFETPGGRGGTPESRLELLRAELASARARYSLSHPDVVRLEREVDSLESVVTARAGSSAMMQQEAAMVAELATLRERYTNAHPDVQRVRRELEAVRQAATEGGDDTAGMAGASRTSSYIQLSAQLNRVQAEIGGAEEQLLLLEEERLALQEQLAQAPAIEREYNRLQRQLESALADREALADKETSAKLSGSLEATASSERLILIEPPSEPNSPHTPHKKLILAIGFVLASAAGGTSLLASELLDRSIRSTSDLAKIVGDTPLVAIPVIVTTGDRRRQWLWRFGAVVVVLGLFGGGLTWVHHRVAPLDVLGYQAIDRAERMGLALPLTVDNAQVPDSEAAQ